MKIVKQSDTSFSLQAKNYSFKLRGETALLEMKSGHEFALSILSTLCRVGERDLHLGLEPLQVRERDQRIEVIFPGRSNLWDKKEYHFLLSDERIEYFFKVTGKGRLDRMLLLSAMSIPDDDQAIEREDFQEEGLASSGNFEKIFYPQPNANEKHEFSPREWIRHGVDYRPDFWGGSQYFTPAPFCYPFKALGNWMGVTLAARPGEYRFMNFDYWGGEHFCFCIDYEGYWTIEGSWESPHLIFDAKVRKSAYQVLRDSNDYLFRAGWFPGPEKEIQSWWKRPLFCGWGEQCYLHHQSESRDKQPQQSFSTQDHYQSFIRHLVSKGVEPGTIIIDDRWMTAYGDPVADPKKWKNLRGFIEDQHRAGRKVLLWIPTWEREGIPENYCIRRNGEVLKTDPTHPEYLKRLKMSIRRMLGKGETDYNADGFKIDFTANIPSGPGCELYNPIWGVELLRSLMSSIYNESKAVKPDALIIAHTAHPYFADCMDMIRLNDMVLGKKSVLPEMTHRAKIAQSIHSDLLVDMDNWPCPDRRRWLEYMKAQPRMGVPSLYYATHIGCDEEIRDEDYEIINNLWAEYQKK